jgi:hypothetical protein
VNDSGAETRPFDVVEIELGEPCPTLAQPENRLRGEVPWRYVRSLLAEERESLLSELESEADLLLGNDSSVVSPEDLSTGAAAHSLAVVAPSHISWEVRLRWNGTRQIRALFTFNGVEYDLPVTDPYWYRHFDGQEVGSVANQDLGVGPVSRIVVSLGEEWSGRHYKIVATVV